MPQNVLSIYCFFKNEYEAFHDTIPTWLPFLNDGFGELVLVDTGSTDISVQYIEELQSGIGRDIPIRLESLPWPVPIDWAAITKQSMDLCRNPWRMRLDADEKLSGVPSALKSVLANADEALWHQELSVRDGTYSSRGLGTIPVALGGILVWLSEPATGYSCFRSRIHRKNWSWRYRIDPTPVPPRGEDGGLFLLMQPWICSVVHTRSSVRADSLARAESVLQIAEVLDGPLDDLARAHYQEAIDRARIYGEKEGGR